MTSGRLRCLGAPQHLKVKYGGGYILELRLGNSGLSASTGYVVEQISQLFPSSSLVDRHVALLHHPNRIRYTVRE
jgi:hypothetical protein